MKRTSALIRLFATIGLTGIVVGLTAALVAPQVAQVATAGEWQHSPVNLREDAVRSVVYDSNGQLMATWFEFNRSPVRLDQIPIEVQEAILAIEDADFYTHEGINLKATARAVVENVDAGGISQGGSTITQQIIKNLVLSDAATVERKINEAALAVRLEDQMSKEAILETYLNTVYFGSGAYGVQAAAEVYFGLDLANKTDEEVTQILEEGLGWSEAALLASLIRSPETNDPTLHPSTSRYQRGIVLDRLAELELITPSDADSLRNAPLPTERNTVQVESEDDFFVEEVRRLLDQEDNFLPGADAAAREALRKGGGIKIYTTFNPRMQRMAERARDNVLRGDDPSNPAVSYDFTASIAAIDPRSGAVRAMVGGEDFEEEKFNLALQGKRQPGSSFKTFSLVAALRQGIQTNDQVNGRGPCKFEDAGSPEGFAEFKNFGNSAGFIGTIAAMTTSSSNCGYVRIEQLAGLENVIDTARIMGIETSEMQPFLSLTLGAFEVTPMDMAQAYGTLASGGIVREPYFIERIEDDQGNVLYTHDTDEEYAGTRVLSEDVACWATDVLAANVRGGTGTNARLPDQVAAGKTGTAENFTNAWFVGFTPYLSTAVWMGNPESNLIEMPGTTGGSFPARIWAEFNRQYHENREPIAFPSCPSFGQAGQFLKVEGDVDIGNTPCNGDQIVLDFNSNQTNYQCVSELPPGFTPCPYDHSFVDDRNRSEQVFCGKNPDRDKDKDKDKDKGNEDDPAAEPAPDDPAPSDPAPADQPPAGGGGGDSDDSGL